jgi:hypothetical protein
MRGLLKRLREKNIREKILGITRNIKEAESVGDKAGARKLMEEFQKLMEEQKVE